ncbi:MAG: fibronectin type III domain-containing protein [Ferruginibacter sp.]
MNHLYKSMPAVLKKIGFLVYACIIGLVTSTTTAQTTAYIGTSGSTTSTPYIPVYIFNTHSASEVIYLGTEINKTGNIKSISFEKLTGSTLSDIQNVTVYMKSTSNTTVGTTTSLSGYTQVWNGTITNNAATMTQTITFTTPFPFTSSTTNNLAILVTGSPNTSMNLGGRPNWKYTSATSKASYYGNDATPWSSSSTMIATTNRPNVTLTFDPISSCITPTGLQAENITSGSASLKWTAPATGTPTQYQWEIRSSGTPGSGNTGLVASGSVNSPAVTTAAIAGLSSNTSYTAYVRSYCGGSDYSIWSGAALFTTLCASEAIPYTEGFEGITANNTIPACMAATSLGSKVLTYTAAQASYNRSARTGSKFASFYYSANDWIFTKPLALTAGKVYRFSAWYITDGNTGWTTLQAKFGAAQTSAGMTGTITGATVSSPINTAYTQLTGTFTATSTGNAYVGINCIAGSTPYYLSVDDISVTEVPVCNPASFPASVNATASKTTICSEETVTFGLGASIPDATGITYQWRSSADGTTYINAGTLSSSSAASLTVNATAKFFKCEVYCSGSLVLTSNPVQIALSVEVLSTTPASRCGTGTVTLGATTAAGNTLNWYDVASGGSILGSGSSFITPSLAASKNYFVAAKGSGSVVSTGPAQPSAVSTSYGSTNNGDGVVFDALETFKLVSVTVYPVDAAADNIIYLKNASDITLKQATVSTVGLTTYSTTSSQGSPLVINLGWDIPKESGLKLVWNTGSSRRLLRNTSGATSYYTTYNSLIKFNTNTSGFGNGYWYSFYNWQVSSGCFESAQRVQVAATVNNTNTWIGGSSTNWADGANWSCGTAPTGNLNVAVNSGNVVLNQDYTLPSGSNLSLDGTATLTIAPNKTLTIAGTASFNDKHVIVQSTAAGTGAIGKIAQPATVTGLTNVTVERFIPAHSKRAWRLLSAPVSGQTIKEAWQENASNAGENPAPGYGTFITKGNDGATGITANPGDGFDYKTPYGSLKIYDGANWIDAPNTTSPISAQDAYFLYIRGDRSAAASPSSSNASPVDVTLRCTGTLTKDAYSKSFTNQFEVIGNKYASAIDFESIASDNRLVNTGAFFYVWDPLLYAGRAGYQTMYRVAASNWIVSPGGGSFASATSRIESGAAFFVQNAGTGNASITINENDKASGSNTVFRPAAANAPAQLKTTLFTNDDNQVADVVFTLYDDTYSNAIDGKDAMKFAHDAENLAILNGDKKLIIEARRSVEKTDTVHFEMWNLKAKSYRLVFSTGNFNSSAVAAVLEDKYLNTITPVNLAAESTINFTVNSDAASYSHNRFALILTAVENPLPVFFSTVSATATQSGAVAIEWNVRAENRIQQYQIEYSNDGINFVGIGNVQAKGNAAEITYSFETARVTGGNNYYRIKSVGISGEEKYSNIAPVFVGNRAPGFAVYPNPVKNGHINLQLKNQPGGVYIIRLMNTEGQVLLSRKAIHAGGSRAEILNLPPAISKGTYHLEIQTPANKTEMKKIIIQ